MKHLEEWRILRDEWWRYEEQKRNEYWEKRQAMDERESRQRKRCPWCRRSFAVKRTEYHPLDDGSVGSDEGGILDECTYCSYERVVEWG